MLRQFPKLRAENKSIQEIANIFGLSKKTVYEYLQEIADSMGVSRDDLLYEVQKTHDVKNATGRKIVGDADIFLFHDIDAGNLVYKCLVHTTKSVNGCILVGTSAPCILTSRSDTFEVKLNSIALAAVVAHAMDEKN